MSLSVRKRLTTVFRFNHLLWIKTTSLSSLQISVVKPICLTCHHAKCCSAGTSHPGKIPRTNPGVHYLPPTVDSILFAFQDLSPTPLELWNGDKKVGRHCTLKPHIYFTLSIISAHRSIQESGPMQGLEPTTINDPSNDTTYLPPPDPFNNTTYFPHQTPPTTPPTSPTKVVRCSSKDFPTVFGEINMTVTEIVAQEYTMGSIRAYTTVGNCAEEAI